MNEETYFELRIDFAPDLKTGVIACLESCGILSFQEGIFGEELSATDTSIICWPTDNECLNQLQIQLQRLFTTLVMHSKQIQSSDWANAWKQYAKPIQVTPRLLVTPEFLANVEDFGVDLNSEIILRIDPGGAFGTGGHETTFLCLSLLEEFLRPEDAPRFLDVGTGSGVLAIAAEKLGAKVCIGLDIDAEAVRTAKENAERNNSTVCHFSQDSVQKTEGTFELIAANIISSVLDQLLPAIRTKLAPGGRLILSGLLSEEVPEFCQKHSLSPIIQRTRGEWAALVIER